MKKILRVLFILSMVIGGTVIATNTTQDVQAATKIQSNRWYKGMTNGTVDQVYTYKMQGSGYFYYQVVPYEGGYYYKDEFQETELYSVYTSMVKSYKLYEDEDAIYLGGGFKSSKYAFKAGDNITIKVSDQENHKTKFKIKVTFVKIKNFEKENNNSRSKANRVKKGITYTGIGMSDNSDWFVFKAPKTKKYKIKVVNTSPQVTGRIGAQSYVGSKQKREISLWGGEGWTTVYSGKVKKGKKVYVKIDGYFDNTIYKVNVK